MTTLASFVKSCDAQCCGGPGADCVILQDLAGPKPTAKKRAQ